MRYFLTFLMVCLISAGAVAQVQKRGGYDFHLSLAQGYYDQQEYAKAIESIKDALRSKRNDPSIYVLRAYIHIARNNNADAIRDLQRASRIGSEEADKMLIALGAQPHGALSKGEVESFESDVDKYLKRIEAEKQPKQKRPKKTKTRK
jgi:tetratricopeptide (TPR) repeat protein